MRLILFSILFSLFSFSVYAVNDRSEEGLDPFILIARVLVKPDMVKEYLEIANIVDNKVNQAEPGMLFHNFDSDPDNPLAFNWTEVYQNSEALIEHLNASYVAEYVTESNKIGDITIIEIYGNLSQDAIKTLESLGLPFKRFKSTQVGFVRKKYFK